MHCIRVLAYILFSYKNASTFFTLSNSYLVYKSKIRANSLKKKKKKPLEISLADQEMLVEYIFNFSKWLHIHRVPL